MLKVRELGLAAGCALGARTRPCVPRYVHAPVAHPHERNIWSYPCRGVRLCHSASALLRLIVTIDCPCHPHQLRAGTILLREGG